MRTKHGQKQLLQPLERPDDAARSRSGRQRPCNRDKQSSPTSQQLKIYLEIHLDPYEPGYEKIKQAVAVAAEIQKEHSCNCTLFVKT